MDQRRTDVSKNKVLRIYLYFKHGRRRFHAFSHFMNVMIFEYNVINRTVWQKFLDAKLYVTLQDVLVGQFLRKGRKES